MKTLPLLTAQQAFVLIRLFNEPQRQQGPIAKELATLKLVTLRPHWVSITSLGRKAVHDFWQAKGLPLEFEDAY